jgi:hypothetical protein
MVIGRGRRREHSMDSSEGVKWPSVTTGVVELPVAHAHTQGNAEGVMCLSGSMFCAYPAFSRAFFLVVVTWLPDVTKGHMTPSAFPWVCACATGSSTTPVVTEGHLTKMGRQPGLVPVTMLNIGRGCLVPVTMLNIRCGCLVPVTMLNIGCGVS